MINGVVCATVLMVAVWFDITQQRIPNALVATGLVAGVTLALLPSGIGVLNAASGMAVGLAVFLPLYFFGVLGGGDVKLLATIGAFVGFPDVLHVAWISGLAGGLIALLMAFASLTVIGLKKLPYAVAIASGTLMLAILRAY